MPPATAATTEQPKMSESTVAAAAAAEPSAVPVSTVDTEAAHPKRPYEKPIFSSDEVKPHKMPKTEEEQAAAGATDKEALTGAGPAVTAAQTVPEPVPVPVAPTQTEEQVAAASATSKSAPAAESKASPVAVAAAAAAINTSKTDKGVTPAAAAAEPVEPKKPEAVFKRGEETKPKAETKPEPVKTDIPAQQAAPAPAEPAKAPEPTAEQPEKKKVGFFARLKKMFK